MSKLPSVTSNIPRDLRNFIDRVREAFNATGNDRIITVRDLVRGGIASSGPGGSVVPVDDTAVYGTPPALANLAASGALANIILTWDAPRYAGHAYAEIWSSATNNIATASLLGTSQGTIYVDNVGAAATKYYWARFVNLNEVFGSFNSAVGTLGQTGSDPAYLLDVLTGSITSSELSTALNAEITDNTTDITNINNLYMVKMSNSGFLSGFGLMSTLAAGGVATSDFFVNVNRFAVTAPITAMSAWASSTSYAVNASVKIGSTTTKILICKVSGTSGGSAPSISGDIGSLVTDGSITWQIASSVPLAVLTTSLTVNGVTLAPGVYIDGASIVNATIGSAQIRDASIDNAKIANLSASKLTAGSIDVGSYIQSTNYVANTSGWKIDGNGNGYFNSLAARNVTIYDTSGNVVLSSGSGVIVDYANITGTKPPSNADKTSLNTAAAIAGQGGFATLSQITAANVSTYIASAAIGAAYIGSLNADVINAGTITGRTLRTAASGQRVEISSSLNNLAAYNSSGTAIATIGGSTGGLVYVVSTVTLPAVYATGTNATAIYGAGTTVGGVFGTATSGDGVTGSSSTSGIGVYGVATNSSVSSTNHGVRGKNNRNSASGLVGAANGFDFYAEGPGTNYGPFTGTHEALTLIADTFTVGDIVIDTAVIRRNGISSTIAQVTNSQTANQKAALGVVCAAPKPLTSSQPAVYIIGYDEETNRNIMSPDYDIDCLSYNIIAINALGEGQINVCGEGGDIAAGDLIVTSSVAGKGMRQADDIVRSYTVAKAREAVTFSSPTEQKQVACIYLCG